MSHSFLVREMPGKKTGECEGSEGECRVDYFSVNENHDQGEFYSLVVCLCDLCVVPISHCYIDEWSIKTISFDNKECHFSLIIACKIH